MPDFSEFQDPWDNYSQRSKNVPVSNDQSDDYYRPQIEQNESSQFFSTQCHVSSEVKDQCNAPLQPENWQTNEIQDNNKIYHEASTEHQNCIVSDNLFEDRHYREKNCHTQEPTESAINQEIDLYNRTNIDEDQEYRHNDQNNYNHEQDYRSNEQKNCNRDEQNDFIMQKHERRLHDNSFEDAEDNRDDNSRREEESSAHDRARGATVTQINALSEENERQNERDRLQDQFNIDRHKERTDVFTTESHSPPESCTKSKSIATQSEPNIAGQLESNDVSKCYLTFIPVTSTCTS